MCSSAEHMVLCTKYAHLQKNAKQMQIYTPNMHKMMCHCTCIDSKNKHANMQTICRIWHVFSLMSQGLSGRSQNQTEHPRPTGSLPLRLWRCCGSCATETLLVAFHAGEVQATSQSAALSICEISSAPRWSCASCST